MVSKEEHIKFYNTEISTHIEEWDTYQSKRMNILISEKELFIGRLWDVSVENGYAIIRFKAKETPRLETPYFAGIIGTDAIGDPSTWNFTYKDFRTSISPNFWSRKGGDINTISFSDYDSDWTFIKISIEDISFFKILEEAIQVIGVKPLMAFAKKDPPINYLINLREYVQLGKIETENFQPRLDNNKTIDIDNENVSIDYYLNLLNENDLLVIQGPPGTGKSYQAAAICDYFLNQSKSVAVCALTNKALIEVASQAPLSEQLKKNRIYKTNLSANEVKLLKEIRNVEQFAPSQGNLFLTTFYKLTDFYYQLKRDTKRFDLIIIEEASQAFLAGLSMFTELGSKTLIIGDHKQLPPVVITENKKLIAINKNIKNVINGLETIASNPSVNLFRLTKTRRLTKCSAQLTGIFYDNSLKSISELNGKIVHPFKLRSIFHEYGGVTIAKIPTNQIRNYNKEKIAELLGSIIKELITDETLKIAVLTPTVELETLFQNTLSKLKLLKRNISISTVHKIQGITSDYTIYFSPLSHPFYELNDNLFNVATSRAKRGTLIITYEHIDLNTKSAEVSKFVETSKNITKELLKM